jgi:hypothetical protein
MTLDAIALDTTTRRVEALIRRALTDAEVEVIDRPEGPEFACEPEWYLPFSVGRDVYPFAPEEPGVPGLWELTVVLNVENMTRYPKPDPAYRLLDTVTRIRGADPIPVLPSVAARYAAARGWPAAAVARVLSFAREHGFYWRRDLRRIWDSGREGNDDLLRLARNAIGPSGLDQIRTPDF